MCILLRVQLQKSCFLKFLSDLIFWYTRILFTDILRLHIGSEHKEGCTTVRLAALWLREHPSSNTHLHEMEIWF